MEDTIPLPPLGGGRERWTPADDARLRDALATIDAAGLRVDDAAIGAALGWSPWTIRKRRRALGAALRVRRDPDPQLVEEIRARSQMSAVDIASALGPDKDGRYYSPRSIQQVAWLHGIPLAGGRCAPIPTLAQLASELRAAGWELRGNGRWAMGERVVVLPPPGSTVTRTLAAIVRREIRA